MPSTTAMSASDMLRTYISKDSRRMAPSGVSFKIEMVLRVASMSGDKENVTLGQVLVGTPPGPAAGLPLSLLAFSIFHSPWQHIYTEHHHRSNSTFLKISHYSNVLKNIGIEFSLKKAVADTPRKPLLVKFHLIVFSGKMKLMVIALTR